MEIWTYRCRLNLDNLRRSITYTHSFTHNDIIKIEIHGNLKICDLNCDPLHNST